MHELLNLIWPGGTTPLVIAGLILFAGAARLIAILTDDPATDDGRRANAWLRTGAGLGAFAAWLARGEVQIPAWTWLLVLVLGAWMVTDRTHGGRARAILRGIAYKLRTYAEIAGTCLVIVLLFIAYGLWMAWLGVCRLARLIGRHPRVVVAAVAVIAVWVAAAEVRFIGYHLLACLLGAWIGFEVHVFRQLRIGRHARRLMTPRRSIVRGAIAGVIIASIGWHAGATVTFAWLSLLAPAVAISARVLAQHPTGESARRRVVLGMRHAAAACGGVAVATALHESGVDATVLAAFAAVVCLIFGFIVWVALGQIHEGEPQRVSLHGAYAFALMPTHAGGFAAGFALASVVGGWTAARSGLVEAAAILLALALAGLVGGPTLLRNWQQRTTDILAHRNTTAKVLGHVAAACIGVAVAAEMHPHTETLKWATTIGAGLALAGFVVRAIPRSTAAGMGRQLWARYAMARLALTGSGAVCLAGAAAGAAAVPGALAAVVVAAALGLVAA